MIFITLFTVSNICGFSINNDNNIILFNIYGTDNEFDNNIIIDLNREIKNVFINIGQFNLINMSYKLAFNEIEEFINKLNIYREENSEISGEIQIGNEIISAKDFKEILDADFVIIPELLSSETDYQENNILIKSILKTNISIIDIESTAIYEEINISNEIYSSFNTGFGLVLTNFREKLETEIKKAFSIIAEVIGVRQNEVDISVKEHGNIKQGYELINENEDSGDTVIVVKDTGENSSIASPLFGSVSDNSYFKVIPRAGLELTPYYNITFDNLNDFDVYSSFGIRATWTKGLYTIRPFISLEFPMPFSGSYIKWLYDHGTPFLTYFGGEFSLILRRLQILTQAAFGTHFFFPSRTEDSQKKYLTHLGGYINADFSVLLNKSLKFCIGFGYKIWGCPFDSLFGETNKPLYGGIFISTGMTVKL